MATLDPLAIGGDGELPGINGWLTGVDPPPVGGFHLIPELAVPALAYLVGGLGGEVQGGPRAIALINQVQGAGGGIFSVVEALAAGHPQPDGWPR